MSVMIIGGGIGGFALAQLLRETDIESIVIERAPTFRALGHFIALKGAGVRVLDHLGVRESCAARSQPEQAMNFYTRSGRLLRRQESRVVDAALGGFMMMRRADLIAALYERIQGAVDVRFGLEAATLQETDAGVEVTLSNGAIERVDAVIGADGIHSRTRRQVFGESGVTPLGGCYIALEVDCDHDFRDTACFLARGRTVAAIPSAPGRLAVVVYHCTTDDLRARLSTPRAAREFFAREYADFAPTVRAVFAAIDADSFIYVDNISMVRLPAIARGRIALLGDAAACPTFLSGMGSAYAMVSAEVLAQELARTSDVTAALGAYSAKASSLASNMQRSALQARGLVLQPTRWKAALRDGALALAPGPWFMDLIRRFYGEQLTTA
ncbi:FAD-dependent monooxygenase [Polyangium aurulentum]|uniref:FAD-dependent monooxygenase n=1 Tax=Polyangium aurulentum TaxID=2567896 RepID=UPI0010AED4C6|nr:FAD-dependent monooxygenase [Polyangium aurulentum]UQA57873.1 FAD-dependent monooxygenase [Polyangium aurulentum]